MAGNDRFELANVEAWRTGSGKGAGSADRKSKGDLAAEAITELLQEGGWIARADIIAGLREQNIGTTSADVSLKQLHMDGLLSASKVPGGKALAYALKEWADQQRELGTSALEDMGASEFMELSDEPEPELGADPPA